MASEKSKSYLFNTSAERLKKLSILADSERRTQRAVLERLIDAEYAKHKSRLKRGRE